MVIIEKWIPVKWVEAWKQDKDFIDADKFLRDICPDGCYLSNITLPLSHLEFNSETKVFLLYKPLKS